MRITPEASSERLHFGHSIVFGIMRGSISGTAKKSQTTPQGGLKTHRSRRNDRNDEETAKRHRTQEKRHRRNAEKTLRFPLFRDCFPFCRLSRIDGKGRTAMIHLVKGHERNTNGTNEMAVFTQQWTGSKAYDWKTDVVQQAPCRPGFIGFLADIIFILTRKGSR